MYDIVIGRDEGDRKRYGKRGTILIGKHYVKMGQSTSLSNEIFMDVTRSHVMFVCGKRGGGKCLDGNTIITLADGTQMPISQLEHNSTDILALNSDLKMQTSKKSEFFKRTVSKMLYVRLRSGKDIRLTPEHPLLTVKGWLPACELSIGNKIATPRQLEAFGDAHLFEHQVKLLAYLLAEGHLGNNFVLFTNADSAIVNDFELSIAQFDKNLKINSHGKYSYRIVENKPLKVMIPSQKNSQGQFTSQPKFENRKSSIRQWLDKLGIYGYKSHEKFLCEQLFTLSRQKTALFLNRLFSCDGSIHKKGKNYWVVTYSSSSPKLIKQVSHLLVKFGIQSVIRQKKTKRRDSYELTIRGESLYTYLTEIGFFGKKEVRVKLALKEVVTIKRNPNLDTIPKEIWNTYRPKNWSAIGRSLNYSHPKSAREVIHYDVSRQKLLQIAQADESELLQKLACSDIYWDEIVELKEIEGVCEVYDISVPQLHNFVANDIIVHNSYTLGVIAEGLADVEPEIAQNLSIVILDTMGIYWTMKYPNKKEEELLREWHYEPKGLPVVIYTPVGFHNIYKEKGIPTDMPFSIKPTELAASDWCAAFETSPNSDVGVLVEEVIFALKEEKSEYGIADILAAIGASTSAAPVAKAAAINHFRNAEHWGLFDDNGTPLSQLAAGGQVTILDISCYATSEGGWAIKQMAVGLIAQKLFLHRMLARKDEEFTQVHKSVNYFGEGDDSGKQQDPLVWLVIDEAHEFLPKDKTVASSDPLITILREGRQPGISLILATQQPGKIHTDVLTQSDIVLSHRITAKIDTDALGMLMQSYMRAGLTEQLDDLPRVKGAGIIFDDTNEKLFPMRIRPRFTWHGGESPNAIPNKKKYFEN